jgi:hypothetical protein
MIYQLHVQVILSVPKIKHAAGIEELVSIHALFEPHAESMPYVELLITLQDVNVQNVTMEDLIWDASWTVDAHPRPLKEENVQITMTVHLHYIARRESANLLVDTPQFVK